MVIVVAKGKPIKLKATSSETASGKDLWPEGQPTWKCVNGGTFDPQKGPSTTWKSDKASQSENDFEITAKCGYEDGKAVKITVVELKSVKYYGTDGKEKEIPVPFYVGNDSTVKFKAYPSLGVAWPDGEPIWGGEASGNKPEASVKFSLTSEKKDKEENKSISASCGNTLSYKIIVCPVPFVTIEPGQDYSVKVDVEVVDKNVSGSTKDDISKSLGDPPFGQTETFVDLPIPNISDPTTLIVGYNVVISTGEITFTKWTDMKRKMYMPNWLGYKSSTNQSLKDEWDVFKGKLKIHEKGHVEINEKYSSQAAKLMNKGKYKVYSKNEEKRTDLVKQQWAKMMTEINKLHNDAQADYDKKTKDGATQGAVW